MAAQKQNEIRHIAKTIDINNIESGVRDLASQLKPEWKKDDLKLKTFTDGITNKLVGFHIGNINDMILVRIYGEKTELFIDRDVEKTTMLFLNRHGCAKPVHCTFENGLCYGFIVGKVFDENMMCDKKYSGLVAKELARLHTLPVPASFPRKRSSYFLQFEKLIGLLPDKFEDATKDRRFQTEVPKPADLQKYANELETIAQSFGEDFVLCHHDTLIKNLVYAPDEDRVYLIDFEYAGMSYAAVDIGDHFDEFAGVDEVDFSKYPNREYQLWFLRIYLTELKRYKGQDHITPEDITPEDITPEEVEKIYKEVNKMALMAHLFWGLWGIVQACHSTIDFDFLDYGIMKLNEYKRRKDEFIAL